jgi:hypothetical protein
VQRVCHDLRNQRIAMISDLRGDHDPPGKLSGRVHSPIDGQQTLNSSGLAITSPKTHRARPP